MTSRTNLLNTHRHTHTQTKHFPLRYQAVHRVPVPAEVLWYRLLTFLLLLQHSRTASNFTCGEQSIRKLKAPVAQINLQTFSFSIFFFVTYSKTIIVYIVYKGTSLYSSSCTVCGKKDRQQDYSEQCL